MLRKTFSHLIVIPLSGALLLGACTAVDVMSETLEPPVTLSTTTTAASPPQASSTTSVPEAASELEESTTTTTAVFVDYADPVRMFSEALDTEAVVSEESRSITLLDPLEGEVLWHRSDDLLGPCENGLIRMLSHLNKGEPHFNLVDDSAKDKHGKEDHGLVIGDTVSYVLVDNTICVYTVIEPLGIGVENVRKIEGQPAIYFPKNKVTPIVYALLDEIGDRSVLSMWVSYGGPAANEYKPPPNDKHRLHNAVVFAELTEVVRGNQ